MDLVIDHLLELGSTHGHRVTIWILTNIVLHWSWYDFSIVFHALGALHLGHSNHFFRLCLYIDGMMQQLFQYTKQCE